MEGLLNYNVKKYDFGTVVTTDIGKEILIYNKDFNSGDTITIPRDLGEGKTLNRAGLMIIQNLSVTYEPGIYEIITKLVIRESTFFVFDDTLSTPDKINLKSIKSNNTEVLVIKNNTQSKIILSARIILAVTN